MSRVSENSSIHAVNYAVGKTKSKVEDLQIKGSSLKRIAKPSDDPVGNADIMTIRSRNIDSDQYLRSMNYAQTQLALTEDTLGDITDLLMKAKEIAVGQASSYHNPEIRQGVAKEVHQLREQLLTLANKRVGNRFIFAGQKTLTRPFDQDGNYLGDQNKIKIEINKDVLIPINITGTELFYSKPSKTIQRDEVDIGEPLPSNINRDPASINLKTDSSKPQNVFDDMRSLESALLSNNPEIIQGLLERLDSSINNVVAHRTTIGALTNTISNNETITEKSKILGETQKSKIEDADVAELFSNLQKEQNVLKASYQASSNLLNTNLLDFIR